MVLGNPETDELLALKRASFSTQTIFSLSIQASAQELQDLRLYLMCDSYLGMDQEVAVPVNTEKKVYLPSMPQQTPRLFR